MVEIKKPDEAAILAEVIVKGMEEKKAKNIVMMDLRGVSGSVSDFFVICHGDSDKQVEAIARSIEEEVYKTLKEDPWGREGLTNCEWALIDYINVTAHVFLNEKRDFYQLERLWGDAKITKIESSFT